MYNRVRQADLEGLWEMMETMKDTRRWPAHRQPFAFARQMYVQHCIAQGKWAMAVFPAVKTYLVADPVACPEPHDPTRLLLISTLISILAKIRKDKMRVPQLDATGASMDVLLLHLLEKMKGIAEKACGKGNFASTVERLHDLTIQQMAREGKAIDELRAQVPMQLHLWRPLAEMGSP